MAWLDDGEVAAELGRIQANRARETAREAELILRLAQLRPDAADPTPPPRRPSPAHSMPISRAPARNKAIPSGANCIAAKKSSTV